MTSAVPDIHMPEEVYKEFIYRSRHSRWDPEKNRRKTWPEGVDDYLNHMWLQAEKKGWKVPRTWRDSIRKMMMDRKAVGSMRAFKAAGKHLEKDQAACFNCMGTAADHPRVFDEICYLLMLGCGVGVSVERQLINKLPDLPEELYPSPAVIPVSDSKIGWSAAVKELIALLYSGSVPSWDLSRVRPAGSVLKTSGGRASGPEPLDEALRFIVDVFKGAVGAGSTKLNSLECTDIICKIAESIVAGGSRRSAILLLCNPSDDRMRNAKTGNWMNLHPQRRMANISSAYTEKPSLEQFMEEWFSLMKSGSGERGFFNRQGVQSYADAAGERRGTYDWITNPCFSGDMRLKTSEGYRKFEDLEGKEGLSIVNADGNTVPSEVWCSGEKEMIELRFRSSGPALPPVQVTPDHIFRMEDGSELEARHTSGRKIMSDKNDPSGDEHMVDSVKHIGIRKAYDFSEPETNWGVVEGVVAHNCGEAVLRTVSSRGVRGGSGCNLSEAVIGEDATPEQVRERIWAATVLGTIQASFTDFRYLRKGWKTIMEEDALLGVSLTGIMDNPFFSGAGDREELKKTLEEMREYVKAVNRETAGKLGINPAAAACLIKPSGTVSKEFGVSPGIHCRKYRKYVGHVIGTLNEPFTQFLRDQGVPWEKSVYNPRNEVVFKFPVTAPETVRTEETMDPAEMLDMIKIYRDHWCDGHNVSCTVVLDGAEWFDAASWMYRNWDTVGGITFFPEYYGGTQLPYQKVSDEEWDEALRRFPGEVDWNKLSEYEHSDYTENMIECAGPGCALE